jgi:bifunctional non-homologous end joining protein LigD
MPTTRLTASTNVRLASRLPQIDPIIPIPRSDAFDDPAWVFEPKYDGIRGVVYASGLGCEIRSARNFRLERFRSLWDRVAEVLRRHEAILDGEIVSLNRQGKPVYRDLVAGPL